AGDLGVRVAAQIEERDREPRLLRKPAQCLPHHHPRGQPLLTEGDGLDWSCALPRRSSGLLRELIQRERERSVIPPPQPIAAPAPGDPPQPRGKTARLAQLAEMQ